jgi:hypothetical protein
MDPASTLIGLAEVSLTLAGFAAIVLVLGNRDAPLGPGMIADVRIMITNAAGSALACLVAIAYLLIIRHLERYSPRLAFFWW